MLLKIFTYTYVTCQKDSWCHSICHIPWVLWRNAQSFEESIGTNFRQVWDKLWHQMLSFTPKFCYYAGDKWIYIFFTSMNESARKQKSGAKKPLLSHCKHARSSTQLSLSNLFENGNENWQSDANDWDLSIILGSILPLLTKWNWLA